MNLKDLYSVIGHDKKENEMSKFEEHRLKEDIKKNKKLFARNKDLFIEDKNFLTCSRYNPCPICDKCLNKASHLYIRCQNCGIPICVHKHKDRITMIKRNNFKIKVTDETFEKIRNLVTKER